MTIEFPKDVVITEAFGPRGRRPINPNTVDNVAHLLIERYAGIEPAIDIVLGMFEQQASPAEVMSALTQIEDVYRNPQATS